TPLSSGHLICQTIFYWFASCPAYYVIFLCYYYCFLPIFLSVRALYYFNCYYVYCRLYSVHWSWNHFHSMDLICFITGQYVLTIELAALYGVLLILRQMMEPKIIAR